MHYYLSLLFLFGMQICMATTYLPDTVAMSKDYLALAQQYETEGVSDKAIEYYELARLHYAEKQDDVFLVYVLNRLAALYKSDNSTWEKSQAYLDTANHILDEKLYKNDTLRALTWYTMAEFKSAQRKFDEAIAYYQKSLERKKSVYGENHLQVAEVLEQIGSIYLYNLQNPYESEQYHVQALRIREILNDQSRFRIHCFYYLAVANRLLGDYEKALAYGFRALQGYEDLPEARYKNIVVANNLLGNIYFDMDSIEAALGYSRSAIDLATSGKLLQPIDISLYYNNQAMYHFQFEAYDSTIYYAKLAIEHQARPDFLANSYQFLGSAYLKKGQIDKAFRNLEKSKILKESFFKGQHTQLATLYVDLGRAFETDKQIDSALYYYHKAMTSAKISQGDEVSGVDLSIEAGDDLASMQEALSCITNLLVKQFQQTNEQGYLVQALPYFQLFDRFMDLSRTNFSTEGSKLILSGDHKATYEQAIATNHQLYLSTQTDSLLQNVFHFMEKSKAMVLLESIYRAGRYRSALPDSMVKQDQSFKAQLAHIQSEIINAEQQGSNTSDISEWQIQKAMVLQKIDSLNLYIQTNYPNFYNITFRNLTLDIDSLQKQITKDEAFVSYFWGDSTVYALLITPEVVKAHQIKDISALNVAIAQYYDVLANDEVFDPSYQNYLKFQQNAYVLYQLLLAPLLNEETPEHLTIVADGKLTSIPFESLITSRIETKKNDIRYESLPYIIKKYEISYEFSLSVAFWERQYSKSYPDINELNVVAFGIKSFDKLAYNQHYPRLAGAEDEVNYVQEKFPYAHIFLNNQATEAQFKMYAPQADLLHIATHGMADLDNPFASKFIFYPEGEEDGILNLYELYDMPLKAKVLLLSACESGVGKHYAGEGNYSLARSFVYAGCKSVVMSLWQVNDFITEKMIKGIYDQLAVEQSISTALRTTKLAFIDEGTCAHPQCWAGMVPLGNTSIEFPRQTKKNFIIASIIILSLGAIFFVRIFPRIK